MSSAIFLWYEKPQSCTCGGARAKKFCQGLLTAPLDENDYHLTFSTFSSARQKAKLARKNCEILPKNNSKKLAKNY